MDPMSSETILSSLLEECWEPFRYSRHQRKTKNLFYADSEKKDHRGQQGKMDMQLILERHVKEWASEKEKGKSTEAYKVHSFTF